MPRGLRRTCIDGCETRRKLRRPSRCSRWQILALCFALLVCTTNAGAEIVVLHEISAAEDGVFWAVACTDTYGLGQQNRHLCRIDTSKMSVRVIFTGDIISLMSDTDGNSVSWLTRDGENYLYDRGRVTPLASPVLDRPEDHSLVLGVVGRVPYVLSMHWGSTGPEAAATETGVICTLALSESSGRSSHICTLPMMSYVHFPQVPVLVRTIDDRGFLLAWEDYAGQTSRSMASVFGVTPFAHLGRVELQRRPRALSDFVEGRVRVASFQYANEGWIDVEDIQVTEDSVLRKGSRVGYPFPGTVRKVVLSPEHLCMFWEGRLLRGIDIVELASGKRWRVKCRGIRDVALDEGLNLLMISLGNGDCLLYKLSKDSPRFQSSFRLDVGSKEYPSAHLDSFAPGRRELKWKACIFNRRKLSG